MFSVRMISALLLCWANAANACQCIAMSVEEGMASSPLVFGGRVVAAKEKGGKVEIELSGVIEIKGGRVINSVTTKSADGSCGFPVTVPAEYVFFANAEGEISLCGATRRLTDPELGWVAQRVVDGWSRKRGLVVP